METGVIIQYIEGFVDTIKQLININEQTLTINFDDLAKHSPELAEYLLVHPNEIQTLFDLALKDLFSDFDKETPQIYLKSLPKSQHRIINRMRMNDLNLLTTLNGIIVSRSKSFPSIKEIMFECPACGNKLRIIQEGQDVRVPTKCACGRKGKFKETNKIYEDIIHIQIEELPEKLKGSEVANTITLILKRNLCENDYKLCLGGRIEVVGYMQEISIYRHNKRSTACDYIFNVLFYECLDFVDFDTKITAEEKKLFKFLNNHPNPSSIISRWIFTGIYGYKKAKEALIYQQFGGCRYGGYRDFIHILLYGSPGTAKTDLGLRVSAINPISKIACGPDITKVGFTAASIKDELTGKYVLHAGLLPRCSGGLAFVDEIEKAPEDTLTGLHTPMENGFLSINKAGISAKVVANTAILATSNPKVGAKAPKVGTEGLKLAPAIIDRFDLIFTFRDNPDTKKDSIIADNILNRATFEGNSPTFNQELTTFRHNLTTFHISTIKKYIYLSKEFTPKLSKRVKNIVTKWYSDLRQASTTIGYEAKIPTPRVIESILRMGRAIARSKWKHTVTQKELAIAIEYFNFVYDSEGCSLPQLIDVND